ncbi:hypothetical protein CCHR01_04733 [Colletotrichum chrysophilum]|uniref:Uncharacterized protein n=1 Tax=Colletotrichum chrysophilum TaxID=1836956 RepID=A0AAD9ARH2_9PEZI|nr:hypothetical protein CCHR01_04733 [Colletotrichum chrysophilum]
MGFSTFPHLSQGKGPIVFTSLALPSTKFLLQVLQLAESRPPRGVPPALEWLNQSTRATQWPFRHIPDVPGHRRVSEHAAANAVQQEAQLSAVPCRAESQSQNQNQNQKLELELDWSSADEPSRLRLCWGGGATPHTPAQHCIACRSLPDHLQRST